MSVHRKKRIITTLYQFVHDLAAVEFTDGPEAAAKVLKDLANEARLSVFECRKPFFPLLDLFKLHLNHTKRGQGKKSSFL